MLTCRSRSERIWLFTEASPQLNRWADGQPVLGHQARTVPRGLAGQCLQFGLGAAATVPGHRAARVEAASSGQIRWIRRISGQAAGPVAGLLITDDRESRGQSIGIR